MSGTARRWRRGCGIGCGATAALCLLLMGGGSLCVMRPFRDAISTRERLVARFGADEDFTPAADGAVPADRLEAFLAVRRAVASMCGELDEVHSHFEAMGEFDGQEEVDKGAAMKAAWEAMKAAMGMGPKMGGFFGVRNAALLEAGMGLGEYSYIYALAYGPRLRETGDDEAMLGIDFTPRVRRLLRRILENQLAAMDAAGERWRGSAERDHLVAEIARLEDGGGTPWEHGAPAAVAASLAPRREEIDALFCADTASLELIRNESSFGGLGVRGE
jgi:hypothetical protein